jgi:hypothetical protein
MFIKFQSVVGGVRRGNRAKKAKQDFTFDENYHKSMLLYFTLFVIYFNIILESD